MARTKKYHDQEEIAHLWFHQTRDHAVTRSGNFYFHDDVIYSYGSHFPIARLTKVKGNPVVLFTTRTYSSTTNQHLWSVRRAIPDGTTIFNIDRVMGKDVLAQLKAKLKPIWVEVREKRRKNYLIEQFKDARDEALEYIRLARKTSSVWLPPDFEEQNRLSRVYEEKREVREAVKQEAREKKRLEDERLAKLKFDEKIKAWLDGKCTTHQLQSGGRYSEQVYLRLRAKNTIIETSLGAQVPVQGAINLWKMVNYCHEHKLTVEYGDPELPLFQIGGFALNRIGPEGDTTVGCHRLTWKVMHQMATTLGVQDETHNPRTSFPAAAAVA